MAYRARVQQDIEIGESDEDEDGVDVLASVPVLGRGSASDRDVVLRDDDSVDLEAKTTSTSEMRCERGRPMSWT